MDYGAEGDGRRHEVIFPAGTSCSSFEIPINDDAISEKDEAFTIKIVEESLPFGVTLGGNAKTDVMIIDNDSEFVNIISACIFCNNSHKSVSL